MPQILDKAFLDSKNLKVSSLSDLFEEGGVGIGSESTLYDSSHKDFFTLNTLNYIKRLMGHSNHNPTNQSYYALTQTLNRRLLDGDYDLEPCNFNSEGVDGVLEYQNNNLRGNKIYITKNPSAYNPCK